MAAEEVPEASSLVYAPTWAVASVCFVLIVCSLLVERPIHAIGQYWRSRKQTALVEALEKIKQELMVVGFISLALAVGQSYVAKICVPKEWTDSMPQCKRPKEIQGRQTLAAPSSGQQCTDKGKADFISLESLHQLHIFIFCLAVVHVVYSVITMALGMWKVHQWKTWEEEAEKKEISSDHGGLRYTKDATFIKRHVVGKWSKNALLSHIDALDVAVHLWSKFTFNEPNCFNRKSYLLAGRIILGLISQVLCGCVVLPIYALVSQMGSHMKEHGDMELCVRLHEDKNRNPSASNEGSTPVTAHSITQLHGAEVGNAGDMDDEGGKDSIVDVNDNLDRDLRVLRKMSDIERVVRRVPGEAYYELKS